MFDDLFTPSWVGWWLLILLFYGWAAIELVVNLRPWRKGTVRRDRLTRTIIIVAMLSALTLAVTATRLHAADITVARAGVFYLGLGLMAAGIVFRIYAIRELGRYFIPVVGVQPGQRLIQTGLYRYLRHPSYTGTFITTLGYGLALTNLLSLAIMLTVAGLAYGWRMRVEEEAMVEAFGEEYRLYMRRTKRILPGVY